MKYLLHFSFIVFIFSSCLVNQKLPNQKVTGNMETIDREDPFIFYYDRQFYPHELDNAIYKSFIHDKQNWKFHAFTSNSDSIAILHSGDFRLEFYHNARSYDLGELDYLSAFYDSNGLRFKYAIGGNISMTRNFSNITEIRKIFDLWQEEIDESILSYNNERITTKQILSSFSNKEIKYASIIPYRSRGLYANYYITEDLFDPPILAEEYDILTSILIDRKSDWRILGGSLEYETNLWNVVMVNKYLIHLFVRYEPKNRSLYVDWELVSNNTCKIVHTYADFSKQQVDDIISAWSDELNYSTPDEYRGIYC